MAAEEAIAPGQNDVTSDPIVVASGARVTVAIFADGNPIPRGARIRILLVTTGDPTLIEDLRYPPEDRAKQLNGPATYLLNRPLNSYGFDFGASVDDGT